MSKLLYIIGAGGHAKVLLECMQKNIDFKVAGFLETNKDLIGGSLSGLPIYEQDTLLKKYHAKDILLVNGLGSTDVANCRGAQFEKLKQSYYDFYSVIHPTSYYSSDVIIDEGSQLLARSTILTGTKIGRNVIINTSASVDHDCCIGNHVHIAPGAVLSGGVEIGDFCHIGVGAKIIQGIRIGKNSLVAAGAVVISNFPDNSRIAGVPAKQISA